MIIWPPKGPAEVEDFAFDFPLAEGETIASRTVTTNGVTKDSDAIAGSEVQVWLSGGTAGTVASVTCAIVTSEGRTYSEVAVLEIGGEAVSLATAKAAQRIEGDDEDALLAGFLRAAVRHVETRTGKNLTQKIETQVVDGFPGCDRAIRLWKGPVSEILSVAYADADGAEQALTSFRLVEGRNGKLLPAYGESFPPTAFGPGTVRVSYVAGYDPADRDLHELVQAAILLFGHWNANREAAIASDRAAAVELPLGVEALIAPHCSIGIG